MQCMVFDDNYATILQDKWIMITQSSFLYVTMVNY